MDTLGDFHWAEGLWSNAQQPAQQSWDPVDMRSVGYSPSHALIVSLLTKNTKTTYAHGYPLPGKWRTSVTLDTTVDPSTHNLMWPGSEKTILENTEVDRAFSKASVTVKAPPADSQQAIILSPESQGQFFSQSDPNTRDLYSLNNGKFVLDSVRVEEPPGSQPPASNGHQDTEVGASYRFKFAWKPY